jgi:hypothetical protein
MTAAASTTSSILSASGSADRAPWRCSRRSMATEVALGALVLVAIFVMVAKPFE